MQACQSSPCAQQPGKRGSPVSSPGIVYPPPAGAHHFRPKSNVTFPTDYSLTPPGKAHLYPHGLQLHVVSIPSQHLRYSTLQSTNNFITAKQLYRVIPSLKNTQWLSPCTVKESLTLPSVYLQLDFLFSSYTPANPNCLPFLKHALFSATSKGSSTFLYFSPALCLGCALARGTHTQTQLWEIPSLRHLLFPQYFIVPPPPPRSL